MSAPRRCTVEESEAGTRLDRYLAAHSGAPRNQVQRWIRDGLVRVGGRAATKSATALEAGDEVAYTRPAPVETRIEPEPGALAVRYEDPHLVVLDKPAGIAVHPGAGRRRGTLAHFLLHRFPEIAGVGGPGRPGIVHRLDKDTTGLLAVARSEAAYQALARAFAERRVAKTYLAVVYGRPSPAAGRVDLPIGRHPRDRKRMIVRAGGRPAVTDYRTAAERDGLALLELDLLTGRTHQIRVHAKAIGHPLLGDPVYGEARWRALPPPLRTAARAFPRPALHAWKLAFDHPVDSRPLAFEAPPPADLAALIALIRR